MQKWKLYSAAIIFIALYGGWQWQTTSVQPSMAPLLPQPIPTMSRDESSLWLKQMIDHDLWSQSRGKTIQTSAKRMALKTSKKFTIIQPRLLAISYANNPARSLTIIQVEQKQPPRPFYQGDTLPNGAVLQQILVDGVILEKKGEIRHVYLFGKR